MLLVDVDSGDARQCADAVLAAVRSEGVHSPGIVGELLQNTVELVTGVCRTVGEAGEDLARSLERVRTAARPMRVAPTGAGTHPFARWAEQRVTDSERYATLIDRTQWWGRQMTIYGVHAHVGVAHRDALIPLTNALLTELGPMLAMSASSPFWQAETTRYASNRSLLFQQLPTAGLPYELSDWAQYEAYIDDMRTMGVIEHINEIRWDIRPVPMFGTIEIRVADSMPTLREVLALGALAQCLVDDLFQRWSDGAPLPRLAPWQIAENKWRAARYGMDAHLVVAGGGEEPAGDRLRALVDRLMPTARTLGCADELAGIDGIVEAGASYQRQLAVAERTGGPGREVVAHLVEETASNTLGA